MKPQPVKCEEVVDCVIMFAVL